MKRVFVLMLLVFACSRVFSQIEVKDGSFRKIEGYVMMDKHRHTDDNNAPMALIKITTENMKAEDRKKFIFKGNLATYFDVEFHPGEIYVYISAAAATFMEIIHDDYGKYEYWFPYDLQDFCGYEMVIRHIPLNDLNFQMCLLTVITEPDNVRVFVDDVDVGVSPLSISTVSEGIHHVKLMKDGFLTMTREIQSKQDVPIIINEKLEPVKSVTIMTDQGNGNIYVDGNYCGTSHVTVELTYGIHEIKAERDGRIVVKSVNVSSNYDDKIVQLVFGDNLTFNVNGVCFDMIYVEGGTFLMGNEGRSANDNEYPLHKVTLSDFYIGETEVTQELWSSVMGYNPSVNKGALKPVENVSWNDCEEFIERLSGLTGMKFRLPTEAEWEYSARGGNVGKDYKYSGSNRIKDVAWYYDNSNLMSCEVKSRLPNELGVYDMSGNVWEWCYDIYDEYKRGHQTNPTGASVGHYRVNRGGCYYDGAIHCRNTNRTYILENVKNNYIGFRLALSL